MARLGGYARIQRAALWFVGGLLGLLAALVIAAVLTYRSGDPSLYPPTAGEQTVPVRITLSYKWMHAELAVPRALVEDAGGPAEDALRAVGEGEWIVLGWGDEDYYRERGLTDHRLADFLRSMLVPDSEAVVEFSPMDEAPAPENTGKRVLSLKLSRAGAEALAERLNASFVTKGGLPQAVGRGRAPGSQFFLGHDESDLGFNCNHWIATLLNEAGVPQIGMLTTISPGFALSLTWLGGAEWVEGDDDAHERGAETPPSHSGRYFPISGDPALMADDLVFDGYALQLGGVLIDTAPAGLVTAEAAGLADALRVPPDSLVGIRRIERVYDDAAARSWCAGASPSHLVIGYRANDGGPYEIAVAVFPAAPLGDDAASPCAIAWFRQP